MKAKRLVFPEKLRVEIEEFNLPDDLGPEEILVENLWGLISPGTELAMFTETHVGFPIPDFDYAKFPFRPGYATVSSVMKVGAKINELRRGDLLFTRVGHASHAILSVADRWHLTPDGMPIEHVPFTALAQIALSSVRLSNIRLGHTVVIFGQGLIGNLAAQLMKIAGARKVIGIDPILQRLKISTQCGIDLQINPVEANVTESIDQITSGKGCQIVVEATGRPEVASQAIQVASQMGQVILLGSPRGSAEIDLYFGLHRKGVSLIGAHASRQANAIQYGDADPYEVMLEFIASERLKVNPLLTHKLPASQAKQGYKGLLNSQSNYLGVLLDLQAWK